MAELCSDAGIKAVCKVTCRHPEYLNPGHIAKPVAKGEFKDHYTRRLDAELEGYFQRPVLGLVERFDIEPFSDFSAK